MDKHCDALHASVRVDATVVVLKSLVRMAEL